MPYLFTTTESFWTNPQYRVTLNEPDDGDKDGVCQIIVGLMQKDRRKARAKGEDNFAIGYMMYKVTLGVENAEKVTYEPKHLWAKLTQDF